MMQHSSAYRAGAMLRAKIRSLYILALQFLSVLTWIGFGIIGFFVFIFIIILIAIPVAETFNYYGLPDQNTLKILVGYAYLALIILLFKINFFNWTKISSLYWADSESNISKSDENYFNHPDDPDLFSNAQELLESGSHDNTKRAVEMFEHLAEKNNVGAQVKLSYLYMGNKGVSQDHARAFAWASIAAKNNEPSGLYNLGIFYKSGIGSEIDYESAYNSFFMASKLYQTNNERSECYIQLGEFLRHGLGKEIDLDQALAWYNAALMHGNEEAKKIIQETQKLIDRRNSDPDYFLEQAERLRWGNGINKNVTLALPFYEKAARLGDIYSQTLLAYFYFGNEGIDCDYTKTFYWANQASEKSPVAKYYLGVCYHFGLGAEENGPSALSCYDNFINATIPDDNYSSNLKANAKYYIGFLYRDGKCGAVDLHKSLAWFELAKESGHADAEQAANEVRGIIEEQKTQFNNEAYKLINCPACGISIRIPTPIPIAIIRCKKCRARLSIKQDNYGSVHILLLNIESINEGLDINMPITKEDAARILGVSVHDDLVIIKNAWRTLRGQYHPDKLYQMGGKLKELAEFESKKINKAYKILSE